MDVVGIMALVAAGIAVVAALASAWFARRAASSDVRRDMDELVAVVDRFARQTRRESMRRVRAGIPDLPVSDPDGAPPPQLRPGAAGSPVSPSRPETKAELRRRILGANNQ